MAITKGWGGKSLLTRSICPDIEAPPFCKHGLSEGPHDIAVLTGVVKSKLARAIGGAFAQRGHSAHYDIVYPGNTSENHPPTEACVIHSKQHRGCRIQDPGTRGKHQTKTKNPWCTSRGCRVQN